MMNDKWEQFNRIWAKGKSNKTVQSLMQKVTLRGLEPTEENCRDYYMGYIRPFNNRGTFIQCNPMKSQSLMRGLGRDKYGKPRKFTGRNKTKKRRFKK